jgi:hypothetical protein
MYQQEIQFFWPLTEQIVLDLDFSPCEQYEKQKREALLANSVTSGMFLMSGAGLTGSTTWATVDPTFQKFQVLPDGAVGSWQLTPDLTVGRKSKPNLLHRIFTKLMLGWEWKDK